MQVMNSARRPARRLLPAGGASLALAAMALLVLRYAVRGRSSRLFAPSVYRGPRTRRVVALTFDDGPSPGSLALAEYLLAEGIRGTFFLCGANVLRHPEIALELHRRGHELGNHTFSHARLAPRIGWQMNFLPATEIYEELARAQQVIAECTGFHPRLFRAPYGMRWFGLRRAQKRLGLQGVMWTVLGQDWKLKADQIVNYVLPRVSPGGIICLHDGRDTRANPNVSATLQAVPLLVDRLRERGYTFATVSELLAGEPKSALDYSMP